MVQERENIKLKYQKLFNLIKTTRVQHQREVSELIENVNQKTYAYSGVRSKNQDLLMTISELKDKLKIVKKGKDVNTKFDKSATLGKLLCVTLLNKNKDVKAKKVSKTKVKLDKSKPVTSYSTRKNKQRVVSSRSVRRPDSKDTNLKKRVLRNTKSKSTSMNVKKFSSSVSLVSNKHDTLNSTVCQSNASVLKAKTVKVVKTASQNPIRTLEDYSKPSHEGYRNTIKLHVGNNMVPLRSDTIRLLKELTTNRALEKVLIKEEAKSPVTKNINSISLARGEEERNDDNEVATGDDIKKPTRREMGMPVKEAEKENEVVNGIKNEPIRKARKEETTEAPSSQPIEYYLKHRINKKLIEGLVDNHRFSDSLSEARVEKIKGRTYNLLPRGPVYELILRKKITKKEDIRGNFEIPCNIGGLKHMNAMPLSTYMKLTDKRPAKTDIRLFLTSHSYIYPLGIAKDELVEVIEHVYLVDFVILDIKENEKRPFILGTPFLITTDCD
ncbi:hypothetical protein Tco_0339228 [Tanacetum coccineum]